MTVRVLCADLDADAADLDRQWSDLVDRTGQHRPHLVVLPEMPFAPWLAASPTVDVRAWAEAVVVHEQWVERLGELTAEVVVTTWPVADADGTRANEAGVWCRGEGVVARRRKTFLPDEPGFHEARWYERGPIDFPVVDTPVARLGVMVCTELWFPEYARTLGRQGAHLLTIPRATPEASVDRWEAGARVLAMIAGAYCLSVNRAGGRGEATFSGGSVIVDPEGHVLARTTRDQPVAVADLDLEAVRRSRSTYPRYVDSRPR
jgi:N-carbamoylputrescine amidase